MALAKSTLTLKDDINCYCASLPITVFSEDADKKDFCTDYLYDFALKTGLSALASVIIVIVNAGLKSAVISLARWRRFSSVTE